MTSFYYNFKNKTTKRHYEEGTTEVISTNKKRKLSHLLKIASLHSQWQLRKNETRIYLHTYQ